jgi:hypothetical protein
MGQVCAGPWDVARRRVVADADTVRHVATMDTPGRNRSTPRERRCRNPLQQPRFTRHPVLT